LVDSHIEREPLDNALDHRARSPGRMAMPIHPRPLPTKLTPTRIKLHSHPKPSGTPALEGMG